MKRKKKKRAQLAERIGIKPVSFSQAISRNNFDIQYLSHIADALGVVFHSSLANSGITGLCPLAASQYTSALHRNRNLNRLMLGADLRPAKIFRGGVCFTDSDNVQPTFGRGDVRKKPIR